MLRRIKFWLLKLLLNDICVRSDKCGNCELSYKCSIAKAGIDVEWAACRENDIFRQARKVWRLEKK